MAPRRWITVATAVAGAGRLPTTDELVVAALSPDEFVPELLDRAHRASGET